MSVCQVLIAQIIHRVLLFIIHPAKGGGDEEELPSDAVRTLSFTSSNGLLYMDFGALISHWSEGEYKLEAGATFGEMINDGMGGYAAGDHIFVYNVVVKKRKARKRLPC